MIRQRTSFDCGIASMANLFGVTYEEIAAFFSFKTDEDCSTGPIDAANIGILLRRPVVAIETVEMFENYNVCEWYAKTIDARPVMRTPGVWRFLAGRRAIVTVTSLNHKDTHHVVFWDGDRLCDPSNKKRHGPLSKPQVWSFAVLAEDMTQREAAE